MTEDTLLMLALAVIAVVAAVAIWMYTSRRRHTHLREKFGSEYDRAVGTSGSTAVAEKSLLEREKRVSKYKLRALTADERARFTGLWEKVQARFVDDPSIAVSEGDLLVTDLMTTRGYPMADVNRRDEDLTVDHGHVVGHYRAARDIAGRHRAAAATTEDLRQALVHYRALFTDLLDDTHHHGDRV